MEHAGLNGQGRGQLSLTESQEDYLKQIFMLGENGGNVSTQALADRLGVRPASVTGMVHRLVELGLVEHERYRGVRLTRQGRQAALEILRHHRLLETYLARKLGYRWDQVHEEAERLEHVISDLFEARIADALGHPTHDPHGDPIPDSTLSMPISSDGVRLSGLETGFVGRLLRVNSQDRDSLNLLGRLGLVPGVEVRVMEIKDSAVRVEVAGERYLLPTALAAELWLKEKEQ
jgi:DtxR family Mn-dependent transcriptional regulator